MAAKDSIDKASAAARAAQQNQYVKRILEDEQLRENILAAYAAARSAYGRIGNGKPPTKALFEDRKLQRELLEAAVALRSAGEALKQPPRRVRRRGGPGRVLLLALVGGALALVLSEGLRSKLLDMLFGAEEEFQYTPPPNSSSAESTATVGAV